MKQLDLILGGDSWVFGSEIVDPELAAKYPGRHVGEFDYFEENNDYREARIFPKLLGEKLNAANVISTAWPADDNTSICNRVIDYVTKNYITPGKSTEDIFVVIGWTSPERARFWYKDDKHNARYVMWPSLDWHDIPEKKKIWELYVMYLWNKEEYIPRFVETVLRFQNFCSEHNIKWLCFNAFYQGFGSGCSHGLGTDINIRNEIQSIAPQEGYGIMINGKRQHGVNLFQWENIWDTVNPVRYYCKDQEENSWKTFIHKRLDNPLSGWHPSEEGHKLWADEIYNYVTLNNLL
jgi:hypothetical protein